MTLIQRKRYRKLFHPDQFMKAMVHLGEMYKDEVKTLPYQVMCFQECHNAVAWMALKLRRSGLKDASKFYIVTGTYKIDSGFFNNSNIARDHSWLEYHDKDEIIIFDLTLQQFKPTAGRLHIGKLTKKYEAYEKTNLFSSDMQNHVMAMGW